MYFVFVVYTTISMILTAWCNELSLEEMEIKWKYHRTSADTMFPRMVKKIRSGGKVTPEENAELHMHKRFAAELYHQIQVKKQVAMMLKAVPQKKRIAYIPQTDKFIPPSVVWTEIIDNIGLKIAVISFRILLPSMGRYRWATEALRKAYTLAGKSEIDLYNSPCKATILVAAPNGVVIDNQV